MVDASENNSCSDVAADAVSYYSYRFESCPDYQVNPLRLETGDTSERRGHSQVAEW